MIKKWFLAGLLLGMAGVGAFAQTITLDEAVQKSAEEMSSRLPKGAKVAVLDFKSPSEEVTAYIMNELNGTLVKIDKLTVVERDSAKLAAVRKEMVFNDSGEVSNNSAQQIGRMLGAQIIVSGSLSKVGSRYRFKIQALEVETAAIKYSDAPLIEKDKLFSDLAAAGDFTTGERAGAVVLNLLLFGTGSFVQGDNLGGGITASAEVAGLMVLVSSLAAMQPKTRGDYNSSDEYNAAVKTYNSWLFTGVGIYAAGFLFGGIRALTYHKPGHFAAADNPLPVNVALVPDKKDDIGLRLSYTYSY